MPRVLVVDDEVRIRTALARGFRAAGMDVVTAGDGPSGLDAALSNTFDVVVLDIVIPGLSGYRVVQRLRAQGVHTPVLVVSGKDSESDQARSFDSGADGHLVKPFSFLVLLAQVRALIRRRDTRLDRGTPPRLRIGELLVDPATKTASWTGRPIELSPREYALLYTLASQQGTVMSKAELLDLIWGGGHSVAGNAVEVYVSYLRRKFAEVGAPELISTVRGCGYQLGAAAVDPATVVWSPARPRRKESPKR